MRNLGGGVGGTGGARGGAHVGGGGAGGVGRAVPPQDRVRHAGRHARPARDPRGVPAPGQAAAHSARAAGALPVNPVHDVGKLLVVFGVLIALAGVALMLAGRVPWLGRLPGDIHVQRGAWTFYFPLATSLLLSLVLTLVLWIFRRR